MTHPGSPHPWPADLAVLHPWIIIAPASDVAHLRATSLGRSYLSAWCGAYNRWGYNTHSWLPDGVRVCRRCLARLDRHTEALQQRSGPT